MLSLLRDPTTAEAHSQLSMATFYPHAPAAVQLWGSLDVLVTRSEPSEIATAARIWTMSRASIQTAAKAHVMPTEISD